MAVPFLDLRRQYAGIRDDIGRAIGGLLESQQFILGQAVEDFEAAVVDYNRCGQAVGMSSGTDAQLAILMALGIGAGDAVVTTPCTFFATAGCIHRVGAEIIFVDVDEVSFNMSPALLAECLAEKCRVDADGSLRTARGNRVRAVIPVHLFGLCCEMDAICEIARQHNLVVIEDAAQAMGAECPTAQGAVKAGSIGDFGYFSFFPAKNLGAYGDAGLAIAATEANGQALRLVRNHGMEQRYYHGMVGGNFRIDAIQAAILHVKLPHLDAWNDARALNADRYAAAFDNAGLSEFLSVPERPHRGRVAHDHIFHQYVIRARRRDELLEHLAANKIGYGVYYPVPLHLQKCFDYLGYKAGDFPETERAAHETVALPVYPDLTEAELGEVVDVISRFYKGQA